MENIIALTESAIDNTQRNGNLSFLFEEIDMSVKKLKRFPGYYACGTGHIFKKLKNGDFVQVKEYQAKRCKRYFCTLKVDGKQRQFVVAVLVCEAWHGRKREGQECCHWDGDPTNNKPSNLRWGSRADNRRDAIRHGTLAAAFSDERHPNARLTNEQVLRIRELRSKRMTCTRISKLLGISYSLVYHAASGRTYTDVNGDILKWTGKISDEDVLSIREKRLSGMTYKQLAQQFNTSIMTVRRICLRLTYTHV